MLSHFEVPFTFVSIQQGSQSHRYGTVRRRPSSDLLEDVGHTYWHVLLVRSRGSWLKECGTLDTVAGRTALVVFATYKVGELGSLLMRAPVENAALKKQFGSQCAAYARLRVMLRTGG